MVVIIGDEDGDEHWWWWLVTMIKDGWCLGWLVLRMVMIDNEFGDKDGDWWWWLGFISIIIIIIVIIITIYVGVSWLVCRWRLSKFAIYANLGKQFKLIII